MKPDADRLPGTIRQALIYPVEAEAVTPAIKRAVLTHLLERDAAWLITHTEEPLAPLQAAQYLEYLHRIAGGEPLAYVVGYRHFYDLTLTVTPDVLIPRPETEELVEDILTWLKTQSIESLQLIDIGTGSGAIAVTLAVHTPHSSVTAVDISDAALAVARCNAQRCDVLSRMKFIQSDLLESCPGPYHVIAANLPYIAAGDLPHLDVTRWEPALALDGGPDGLDLIRRLLDQAPSRLAAGGLLAMEIGYDQGQTVSALCQNAFPDGCVTVKQDLAGLDRQVWVELS